MNLLLPKLAIIGTVGVPAKYGGFETLVHFLVKNLNKRFDITVYCSTKSYSEEERKPTWNGAKLHYVPLNANGLQSIIYDLWSMLHALKQADVLLVLGVSGCIFLPFLKMFSKKRIIVNIDGLEWRRSKWNWLAKKFLLLSEKIACRFADEIVTDNRILKEYVKIRYNIEGNLIEYGADHTSIVKIRREDIEKYPFLAKDYAFKVARIEPENNLHLILKAFEQIPNQQLVIVGNWNNSAYGRALRKQYAKAKNITLLEPIYEAQALNLLRSNCKFYVHGHSAGGTNPSLVEAMFLKLPVVAFDVIYNRVTANNQAIFFHDLKNLIKIIGRIDQYPLQTIANDMKVFANRRYTWSSVANRYANLAEGADKYELPTIKQESAITELPKSALLESDFHIQNTSSSEIKASKKIAQSIRA